MPPLSLHVLMPFGEVMLSAPCQLSELGVMEQRYTLSCTLHPRTCQCFTEGCKHHPSPGGETRHAEIKVQTFLFGFNIQFWPLWEVLSIGNARQSPDELQVLSTSGVEPADWMCPIPEARLGGGW